ncbi:MAG: hypothetical protein JWM16_775 [Verrucomicrobiales bacterium]|nr:hypothetical protein [Verrucomicrobiales bacterium]
MRKNIAIGIPLLAMIALIATNIPELRRYLRIRRM